MQNIISIKKFEFNPRRIGGLMGWFSARRGVFKDGSQKVSIWDDLSGNQNTGTQSTGGNQPLLVYPKNVPAIQFDGAATYISSTTSATLNPSNEVSVSVWIKSYHLTGEEALGGVVGVYPTTTTRQSYAIYDDFFTSDNQFRWIIKTNNGAKDIGIARVANQWVHLVGIYNGSASSLYKDNSLAISEAHTGTLQANGVESLEIGRFIDTSYFKGLIDDVMVFNKALSTLEIDLLYKFGVMTHI